MNLNEINESNDRSFDYKYLIGRMFPFVKPYLFKAVLGALAAIPVGLLDGVVAFSLKPFMDEVFVNKNVQFAIWIPIAIVGFAIIQGLLKYLNEYLITWAGGKLTNSLKIALFKKMVYFDAEFFNKNTSGLIISRFMQDANSAMTGSINNVKFVLSTVCSSSALVFVMIYNSWKLALIAVLVLCGSLIPMVLIRKKIKDVNHENMSVTGDITTNYNETYSGNKIISSYNLEEYQIDKFDQQVNKEFSLKMDLTKRVGWLSPGMYFIASLGIAGVFWYGTKLIFSGQITSGSFVSFITALVLLYKPLKTLGVVLSTAQGSFVSMSRVINILDLESNIAEKKNTKTLESIESGISFENILFEYEEDQPVLNDINLNVKKGETIAFVGNSGGGKSTIVNLVPRFYDVKDGSVKIDGVDVRDFSLSSLRRNIAVVFQDNFLFKGTIRENILLGKFDASDEQINEALKNAYLDEFIESLPDGIDTEIGERGVKLSGGQKQRLAIARAMIKDAPILILDEATSALDNKSEAVVQKALDKLMVNRTVFVVAHRLSTIQNADKIAVLNEGQLVELGNHDELMGINGGIYQGLYNTQFQRQEATI